MNSICLRVCVLAGFALLSANAQQGAATKPQTQSTKTQSNGENVHRRQGSAERTREFLGLGAPPDAAAAARGEKMFASNCSFCHGIKATGGDTGPDLVRSALVLHDQKGELIGQVVHNGRPEKGMPAFATLTDSQVYDIAEFLHMRVELAANRGTYKLMTAINGDANAGKGYFNGVGKCNTCHSVTGDLAHIGSKFSAADLQQRYLYPANRNEAQKVTVTLPSGETFSGDLKRLDDFDVSLYDTSGNYHSIAITPETKVQLDDRLAAHRELLNHYTDAEMHNLTAYLFSLK